MNLQSHHYTFRLVRYVSSFGHKNSVAIYYFWQYLIDYQGASFAKEL